MVLWPLYQFVVKEMPVSDTLAVSGSVENFRYTFELTNLQLDRPLSIGDITIKPIPEGQAALKEESSTSNNSVVTATGEMAFFNDQDQDAGKARVSGQHVDLACLILSLTGRSHVRMVNQVWEELRGSEWAVIDGTLDRPFIGKVRPRSMHLNQAELVSFIDSALSELI